MDHLITVAAIHQWRCSLSAGGGHFKHSFLLASIGNS